MKRNINKLAEKKFDLIVVGGGIFGSCAAWDAVLRGLKVALLDKGDFSHATSANHFKILHGGIRYLQHGDIYRIRESSRERSAMLRIAPHLAKPIPIVIPTYKSFLKGRTALRAGMTVYDMLTVDRNRGLKGSRKIPKGRLLTSKQVLEHFPGIPKAGLTGGALFYDGQMFNPPRIALSFIKSAVEKGLQCANYVEVKKFLMDRNQVYGVKAIDKLSGDEFEIRGKVILNTAGPWAHRLVKKSLDIRLSPEPTFSRDLAIVLKKRPTSDFGLALITATEDADSILDRGGRHLFIVPWRNYTLVGVWHTIFENAPEKIDVSKEEIKGFLSEVNRVYPRLDLSVKDVTMINTGLTLFGSKDDQRNMEMSFGKRSLLIDHYKENDIDGLITLIGVRATNARGMAQKSVDHVFKKLGRKSPKSRTSYIPIYGGDIDNFDKFISGVKRKLDKQLENETIDRLVFNYGSQYEKILKYTSNIPEFRKNMNGFCILQAEVIHAVREEMARKLSDVVFRRTDLGTAEHPGEKALQSCAQVMADELGWDEPRINKETDEVNVLFQNLRNYA